MTYELKRRALMHLDAWLTRYEAAGAREFAEVKREIEDNRNRKLNNTIAEIGDRARKLNNALDEIDRNKRREPPWLAEFLCVFARVKDIDALMGDFEELFARDCAAGLSPRRAAVRYWVRVLRSIKPQMLQYIGRVGVLGLLAAVLKR